MPTIVSTPAIELVPQVTCPNCWHQFAPEAALYISGHSSLTGDPRLEDRKEKRRFLPTRYSPEGAAIDVMGTACRDLACPNCHLLVPRVLLERRSSLFLSIFGRPSSGKSYFLAAMMRQLKRTLPKLFALGVTEPHPPSNRLAQEYENALFNHPNIDALCDIPRTDTSGAKWYQQVRFGDEIRQYPRPMFFQIAPLAGHPNADKAARVARTLCLYDNSGESFAPGKDTPNNPVTQHMARSSGLFFMLDPTQEPLFLRACSGKTHDPQVEENLRDRGQDAVTDPQHVILATADQNVKKYLGREIAQPLDVPLVVIVTKFDAWKHLLGSDLPVFYAQPKSNSICGLRIGLVEQVSQRLRQLILELAPEIVAATERLSRHVYFVPSSATGCSPRLVGRDDATGRPTYKFRVGDLAPEWVEVPLLWMLSRHVPGLVPVQTLTRPTAS
jgi:hypothetical protein